MEDGNDKKDLNRRDFLARSVKGLAAASLPLITGAESCKKDEPDCSPDEQKESQVKDGELFDVVVIGSGFGATVAVSTLLGEKVSDSDELRAKRHNLKVIVLERGVWWLSSDRDKPSYLQGTKERVQYFTKPDHAQGSRYMLSILDSNRLNLPRSSEPLYKHHSFKDIDVLTASGVGGGSLIYLNVTIPPNEEDGIFPIIDRWPLKLTKADYMDATAWMESWRGRLNNIVTEFPRNKSLTPKVEDLGDKEFLYLAKSRAFRKASDVSSSEWEQITKWKPAPLSIHEYDDSFPEFNPPEGEGLEVCTREGRCFLGCPTGGIQTLDKTMLKHFCGNPSYRNFRLEGLREVTHVEAVADGTFKIWFYDRANKNRRKYFYRARKVILSAGTLGTNEILLRSRFVEKSLNVSEKLGSGFSGNGDLGGFVKNVNLGYRVYPTKGPLITSLAQYKTKASEGSPIFMTVEDGGIPPTLAAVTRTLLDFFNQGGAVISEKKIPDLIEQASTGNIRSLLESISGLPNPCDPENYPTEHQLLENFFYFQCMGNDEANGTFSLDRKARLDLNYKVPPLKQPIFRHLEDIMRKIAERMGGTFVKFPTMLMPNPKLFTLHPLGGCSLGNSATEGVVNTKGQLFKGNSGAIYDNFYVMDASLFPGPVAVNPTLTIVAVSLKIAKQIPI